MKNAFVIGTLLVAFLVGIAAEPVAADPIGDLKEKYGDGVDCAKVNTNGVFIECYPVCLKVVINGYAWCRA